MAHTEGSPADQSSDRNDDARFAAYYEWQRLMLSVHDAFGPLSQPVPPLTFDALARAESLLARFRTT